MNLKKIDILVDMKEPSFSLKDLLFNQKKITKLADEIHKVFPTFDKKLFIEKTVSKFPELELKARISWITEMLREFLPDNYKEATTIILKALPPENDRNKTDNDFGDFIYAPYAYFVAKYGCTNEFLQFSLNALKEITMRFSAEDAIRYFLNTFPEETLKVLYIWAKDEHYHVRRLVSEGTRPKLPWAQKISIDYKRTIPLLDMLFADTTRFVTRSVANHLNDISKIDSNLVLETLKHWQDSGTQREEEMLFIINHSLRTLIKKGDSATLTFLKFSSEPDIEIFNFNIQKKTILVGDALTFSFDVIAKKDERILVDYIIWFQNKAGKMESKKVYKIKQFHLKKNEVLRVQKNHPLRANMTTRTLYFGEHKIQLQINGIIKAEDVFSLVQ